MGMFNDDDVDVFFLFALTPRVLVAQKVMGIIVQASREQDAESERCSKSVRALLFDKNENTGQC